MLFYERIIMSEAQDIYHQYNGDFAFNPAEKTILVVEDDRTHRALMKKILTECKFQTVQAENGIIALSKIDEGRKFDLIIMDLDMPELDGLETTKEIRIREVKSKAPYTPIIAFTTNSKEEDNDKCLAAGMNAYLPKDVWMPKWRSKLLGCLQKLGTDSFNMQGFEYNATTQKTANPEFDIRAFDADIFDQTASLLKEETSIAIDEFIEDATSYINDIKDGIENGDAEKAARASHPLKSNSKGFGLIAVSEITNIINTQSRENNTENMPELLEQLQAAFIIGENKLREAIKNMVF